jgi:hypothetical protein
VANARLLYESTGISAHEYSYPLSFPTILNRAFACSASDQRATSITASARLGHTIGVKDRSPSLTRTVWRLMSLGLYSGMAGEMEILIGRLAARRWLAWP